MALWASRFFIRLAPTAAPPFSGARPGDRVASSAAAGRLPTRSALRLAAALCLAAFPVSLLAETVTLPVAASLVGKGNVPFVSDVRVFNTSYSDVLNVTAVYRFGAQQATATFQLGAREAKAFDDIGQSLFQTPNSFGAVEFVTPGSSDDLVVTSQLRSPASGGGHVGMFIPGLSSSAARAVTVLTGLVNGESRTNVGVYNPNAVGVTATIRLFDGAVLLGTVPVILAPHAISQQNDIYGSVGFGSLVRNNGYATVESSNPQSPLFTYAAEADNTTGDLILIVGSGDSPAPPGFHPPTPTPSGGAGATPTPTPSAGATRIVNVGQSGTDVMAFSDALSGTTISSIHVGDTVMWVWASSTSGPHSTTSGTCQPGGDPYGGGPPNCTQDGLWDSGEHSATFSYSRTFTSAGTFKYYCSKHGYMMTGTVQVQP